jgi:hypothetical protein
MNIQRREKLKSLLITKFMKKYGIKDAEKILQAEVTNFLQGETLTETDLQKLDTRIRALIAKKNEEEVLRQNLSGGLPANPTDKLVLPELEQNRMETMSVHSKRSKMSGVSELSKYSKRMDEDGRSVQSNRPDRIDFNKDGDEWNAIAKYNQKMFEEEKLMTRYKDKEMKKRTKEQLDTQVKEKLRRLNEDYKMTKEYDHILINHCDFLGKLEKGKLEEVKGRVQKEKESRDYQLKDDKKRKRAEKKKNMVFEKELVAKIVDDMEKEKQLAAMKKNHEREALVKVLQENEENKKKQLEILKREREEDIQICDEYAQVLDKQEKDRENYFKNKERKANEFSKKMADTVIKDMEDRFKREEADIRKYQGEKDVREREVEEKKKKAIFEGKKDIKKFLDMQIEEKRKVNDFERSLNSEQAKIWKTDVDRFYYQEQEINGKIKAMNVCNQDFLMRQMNEKKGKKFEKMSDSEYQLNKNILEQVVNK